MTLNRLVLGSEREPDSTLIGEGFEGFSLRIHMEKRRKRCRCVAADWSSFRACLRTLRDQVIRNSKFSFLSLVDRSMQKGLISIACTSLSYIQYICVLRFRFRYRVEAYYWLLKSAAQFRVHVDGSMRALGAYVGMLGDKKYNEVHGVREYHGFVGYPFDYRVTFCFGSIAGGLDHVNPIIRLPLERGISGVLGKDDHSNPNIETLTLEQYLTLNNTRNKSSNPENATFEIKGQLLRELHKTTFSGCSTENGIEHIGKVLEVASLFNTDDVALLRVFPLTFVGVAKRWFDRTSPGHAKNWDELKQNFIRRFCPLAMILELLGEICNFKQEDGESLFHTWERYNNLLFKFPFHNLNDHQKVHTFYNGIKGQTRRIVDSNGLIPGLTASEALKSIQELADHSHKWHSEDILNEWMKKFMINTNINLKNYDSSIKRLENVNHLVQLIYTHNLTNKEYTTKLEAASEKPTLKVETFAEKVKRRILNENSKGEPIHTTSVNTEHTQQKLVSRETIIEEVSMVKLNARCFAILQNKLPPKEKDPGSFILPCAIGTTTLSNALADLGASISIMPFSLFKRLGFENPKHINMVIEMADRSMKSPKGIVKNVLVKINKFISPVDFIILDIIKDDKVPIILGRPMLATAHARIDVFSKKISLKPRDLEELLLSNDDLGIFLNNNDLLLNLENHDKMFLSPPGSARLNNDSSEMFGNPNSNSSIIVDDFLEMDDVCDNLDYRDLTNEITKSPVKLEFLSNMGDDVDIITLTIEQYMALIQDDIRPGVVKPEIGNVIEFEINSNFIRELRCKLFVVACVAIQESLHKSTYLARILVLSRINEDKEVEQRHLKEQMGCPYRTRKTVYMIENPKEVHKMKARDDEGDVDVGKRNRIMIFLYDGIMQPLTPQTVHITPRDDDYVAPATSPTLDKLFNEFGKECSDITRVPAARRQISRRLRPILFGKLLCFVKAAVTE
ncbi:retrovirus-related pol polyprotein from transposon TNT 1-94 [Tanacetum coccineum]